MINTNTKATDDAARLAISEKMEAKMRSSLYANQIGNSALKLL